MPRTLPEQKPTTDELITRLAIQLHDREITRRLRHVVIKNEQTEIGRTLNTSLLGGMMLASGTIRGDGHE